MVGVLRRETKGRFEPQSSIAYYRCLLYLIVPAHKDTVEDFTLTSGESNPIDFYIKEVKCLTSYG